MTAFEKDQLENIDRNLIQLHDSLVAPTEAVDLTRFS